MKNNELDFAFPIFVLTLVLCITAGLTWWALLLVLAAGCEIGFTRR